MSVKFTRLISKAKTFCLPVIEADEMIKYTFRFMPKCDSDHKNESGESFV